MKPQQLRRVKFRNPLVERFTEGSRHPSLAETVILALLVTLSGWAFIAIIVLGDTWRVWLIDEYDMYNVALVVMLVGWVITAVGPPAAAAIGAGMITQETQQSQHELLRLTGLGEAELRVGYTIGALYRVRVLLAIALAIAPALAVATQWTCCVYYDLTGDNLVYEIASTLHVLSLALGFWGASLAGAAGAVRLALWRRVKVMGVAPAFVVANLCCILTLGLGGSEFLYELIYYGNAWFVRDFVVPDGLHITRGEAQLIRLAIMFLFASMPYLMAFVLVRWRGMGQRAKH